MSQPYGIVIMGVSAAGKTTVGKLLSAKLGGVFIDADDLHTPAAVEQMSRAIPLQDDDRRPWLKKVGQALNQPESVAFSVVACSALRREYRDIIRDHCTRPVFFVHLDGSDAELRKRLQARRGHFMPAALFESQKAIVEPLQTDESGTVVDVNLGSSVAAEAVSILIEKFVR